MRLFDDINRSDSEYKSEAESHFLYLNRSARLEAKRVRSVIEEWFSHYPREHANELRGTLRSANDYNHQAAFFELFLHELLIRMGCRIKVHPELSHTTRRPDFLVFQENNRPFYLEATVVTNQSRDVAGAKARVAKIVDGLNKSMKSDRVFLGTFPMKVGKRAARVSQITSWLQNRINALDYEELHGIAERGRLPKWVWRRGDWLIEFTPIPKSPDKINGKIGRVVMGPTEVEWDRSQYSLRDALRRKVRRYGQLDKPYVIAADVISPTADSEDVENALMGDEVAIVSETESGRYSVEPSRKWNGVWTSENGPRNTRNSAILVCMRLGPWSVSFSSVCLYHHPAAKRPYDSALTRLPQWKVENRNRRLIDGNSVREILGLPIGWPE